MSIELTREQRKELHGALLSAFPTRAALARMVDFELGENLDAVTGGGPLGDALYELIVWAQAHGKLAGLVEGARRANPDNPKLRAFEESIIRAGYQHPENVTLRRFADETHLAPGPAAPPQQVERIIRNSSRFTNVEEFVRGQSRSELAVCLIQLGTTRVGAGTGFLVGPDLIMTAFYLADPIVRGVSPPADVRVRFDYREFGDGTLMNPGQEYRLADAWLVDSSPVEELDYVLLRTEGSPGRDPVGGQPAAPPRGWLVPRAHDFVPGESLFVIQHPEAKPLKIALGPVVERPRGVEADTADARERFPGRIAYDISTMPGSGGAPVFSSEWELVALHEARLTQEGRAVCLGVPMSSILPTLAARGLRLPVPD